LARLRVRLGVDQIVGVGYGPESGLAALVVTGQTKPRWAPLTEFVAAPEPVPANPVAGPDLSQAAAAPVAPTFWARHKWKIVSAAIGAVALGTGIGLGLRSHSRSEQAARTGISQPQHHSLDESSKQDALAADVLYGLGACGLVTAGVMIGWDW
jgi:hypothetical protein